jgi:hypothetical protein
METRLRNLLHDLATEMPVDVEGGTPRTLRRARGRRILTAGAGLAIVAALVVVSVSALRFGGEPTTTPAATGPNPQPSGPQPTVSVEGVPPEVAATARGIYDAAGAGDVEGLREFLDPNTFAYNFDDGSDPIPAWRQDPSVLELMVAVLELPAAAPRAIEGYGTFTIWPYLIDSDFDALTEGERADLASLGYTEGDIQLMIDGGHGYQGPRLAIDETGLWRNFMTVGE